MPAKQTARMPFEWFREWCAPFDTGVHRRAYERFVQSYTHKSQQVEADITRTLTGVDGIRPWTPVTVHRMMRAHFAVRGPHAYAQGMLVPLCAAYTMAGDESLAWWALQTLLGSIWTFSPPCCRHASQELAGCTRLHFPYVYDAICGNKCISQDIQWSVILTRDWSTLFAVYAKTVDDISALWTYLIADRPRVHTLWKRMASVQMALWLFAMPAHDVTDVVMQHILSVTMDADADTIVGVAKSFENSCAV